jgi:hypothetical protein
MLYIAAFAPLLFARCCCAWPARVAISYPGQFNCAKTKLTNGKMGLKNSLPDWKTSTQQSSSNLDVLTWSKSDVI